MEDFTVARDRGSLEDLPGCLVGSDHDLVPEWHSFGIFDVEGEDGFRDREEHVLDELTQEQGVVVATGGGVVKRPINRQRLAERGVVIHLDCPMERLLARTARDKKRPLLAGSNREEIIANLMRERAPLYREIADYRFISSDQSAKQLATSIVAKLRADGVV